VSLKDTARHLLMSQKLRDVPIKALRCQVKPFSEKLGFSGRSIDSFPPARFFRLYLSDPSQAETLFCDWMRHCLIDMEAWRISKAEGGWQTGSLMSIVEHLHHRQSGRVIKDLRRADMGLIDEAIRLRVRQYLQLLESVRDVGYDRARVPPILCEHIGEELHIRDGHHRVGVLWALEQETAPVALWNPKSPKLRALRLAAGLRRMGLRAIGGNR